MENARIIIVDRDKQFIQAAKNYLESPKRNGRTIKFPHRVVASASSFEEASSLIEDGDLDSDIVLADLDPGEHRTSEHDETRDVVWLLQHYLGRGAIIITLLSSGELPPGANVHLEKNMDDIRKYIDEL